VIGGGSAASLDLSSSAGNEESPAAFLPSQRCHTWGLALNRYIGEMAQPAISKASPTLTKKQLLEQLAALVSNLPGRAVCFSFNPAPEHLGSSQMNKFIAQAKIMTAQLKMRSQETSALFFLDRARHFHFHGVVVVGPTDDMDPLDVVRRTYEKAFPRAGKYVKKAVIPYDLAGWLRYCVKPMPLDSWSLEDRLITCNRLDEAHRLVKRRRRLVRQLSAQHPPTTSGPRCNMPNCQRSRSPRAFTCEDVCRQRLHRIGGRAALAKLVSEASPEALQAMFPPARPRRAPKAKTLASKPLDAISAPAEVPARSGGEVANANAVDERNDHQALPTSNRPSLDVSICAASFRKSDRSGAPHARIAGGVSVCQRQMAARRDDPP
jgi:hypothetical protein